MAPKPMRASRLAPEVRRELILDAAERLAIAQGSSLTFEEIADAAEVSRGLVYNYFTDRTELLIELAIRSSATLDRDIDAALKLNSNLVAQVTSLSRAYLADQRTPPDMWSLLARSGLLDHPAIVTLRQERCARVASAWGSSASARSAAWVVLTLLESSGAQGAELDATKVARFVAETAAATLEAKGVSPRVSGD